MPLSAPAPPTRVRLLSLALAASPFAAAAARGAADVQAAPPAGQEGPANIGFHHGTLGALAQPAAVALDGEGRTWVAEAARGALAVFGPDLALERRVDLRALAARPHPAGLAIDGRGRVLWTDADAARVHVLDPSGAELARFGVHGSGPGELHRPRGLDAAGGRVAVADEGNHQVVVFDDAGAVLRTIGGHGFEPGRFVRPADVAFGPDGALFVADAGNARVQVFDAEGAFVRAWGDFGPFPGLFAEPSSIEVRAGRVFVADQANHRLQVFDLAGAPLYEWGEHAVMPLDGEGRLHYPAAMAVSADASVAAVVEPFDGRCQVFGNSPERGSGERMVPVFGITGASAHYGTEVAADGDWLAIAAPETHQVLVFENTWDDPRLVAHAGDLGRKAGLLRWPVGLALDGADRALYVCDLDLRRVSKYRMGEFPGGQVGYDPTLPRFVKCVDLALLFAGALPAPPDPGALARDPQGRLYVCDLRNDRVLVLDAGLGKLRTFGRRGGGVGELVRPTGVALDAAGETLYVVDAGNARVQAFDLAGGGARVLDREGSVSAALEALRRADGRAAGLHGIAVQAGGDLLVSDAWGDRLLRITAAGEFVAAVGRGPGLGRVEFRQPRGLARDARGGLVVIDHANHRAQELGPELEYVDCFGSRPFLEPAMRAPQGEGEERED